jgi:hypothetical protein
MLLLRLLRALAASLSASVRTDATLFVGSGNRFDDDRRLVRVAVPARRQSPAVAGRTP